MDFQGINKVKKKRKGKYLEMHREGMIIKTNWKSMEGGGQLEKISKMQFFIWRSLICKTKILKKIRGSVRYPAIWVKTVFMTL